MSVVPEALHTWGEGLRLQTWDSAAASLLLRRKLVEKNPCGSLERKEQ